MFLFSIFICEPLFVDISNFNHRYVVVIYVLAMNKHIAILNRSRTYIFRFFVRMLDIFDRFPCELLVTIHWREVEKGKSIC